MSTIKGPIPNIAGQVMTVNGLIDPENLGSTIMHEHLFIELWKDKVPFFDASDKESQLWGEKLTIENLYMAHRRQPHIKDNYILSDEDMIIAETMQFKNWEGSTIVDVTSIGLGRKPHSLQRVSKATGLNIVMGAGWYQKAYHPDNMDQMSVEDMTDEIVRDVTVGIGNTGVRSGIIGEVGINGQPLTPNEIKSLQASARASRVTGAAITLHRGGSGRERHETMSILGEEGSDLSRVIFGHSDEIAGDLPLMMELLSHGSYIQFDLLGRVGVPLRFHPDGDDHGSLNASASTAAVAYAIPQLIQAGHADRILLSQDVCTKMQLKAYGGTGYSFIMEIFLPEMRSRGVSDEHIKMMMFENPARVLTFAEPQS